MVRDWQRDYAPRLARSLDYYINFYLVWIMNTYKIGIEETCHGYVWIKAESQKDATSKAHDMIQSENVIDSLCRGQSEFPDHYPTMLKNADAFVSSVEIEE